MSVRNTVRGGFRGLCAAMLGVIGAMATVDERAGAQELFTVTAQDRSITTTATGFCSGCVPHTNAAAAPDLMSWTETVSAHADAPSSAFAVASEVSNVTGASLSGSLYTNSFGDGRGYGMASARLSLTFTPTQLIYFDFVAQGSSFQNGLTGGSFSLSGFFANVTVANIGDLRASGFMVPGTSYTLSGGSANSVGDGEYTGCSYTLNFYAIVPANVAAGPITRTETCHRYFQLAASNWYNAEGRALTLGGHLVTVNDAAEQLWLQNNMGSLGPGTKWIGFHTTTRGGPFTWISGQAPGYIHWAPGTPSWQIAGPPGYFALYGPTGLWGQGTLDSTSVGGIVEVEGCRCDWNYDMNRTSDDFFEFVTDFFGNHADFDCSGATTSDDFFGFITCFLAEGCS